MSAPSVPGPNPQGTYHWVISASWQPGNGTTADGTWRSTITPEPGQTRAEVYEEIRQSLMANVTGGIAPTVLFFSLEPNELGGPA